MRIVIFSDIHGNQYSYREFVKQLEKLEYDYVIFCGDVFGYYYGQLEILESMSRLKKLIWLKGNHDQYAVNIFRGKESPDKYVENYGHSYKTIVEKCTIKIMDCIDSLPDYKVLMLQDKKIGIFHGTAEDYLNGRLYPKDVKALEAINGDFDYIILGHTHFKLECSVGNTRIINPGSLGQPRDGKGFGFYLLDLDKEEGKFININVDTRELYNEIDNYDRELVKLKEVLERREIY
ncbi:metallophosphoesterase family protein [Anaerosporobacter sp.]|uniref:metallophosphoesterase family protein n=1 Tax=Anaerosporobacter sp. TaxID=1872529 RepID=UPI00286F867D|nr:metallophosphoesterase family protein [Anaerosporobacter sp.]